MIVNAIRKCEEGHATALTSEQVAHVKIALEAAGIEFTNGDEPGVKLTMAKRAK